jgi:general L-amino acid transport system permease protein
MSAIDDAPATKVSLWNDPKARSIAVQFLLALIILASAFTIVENTITNLTTRNISTGFGFLRKTAGFDLIMSLISYSSDSTYGRAIMVGFLNTLLVSFLGIILATLIGFTAGIMRLSRNWLVSRIGTAYVELVRNVPLLLQIFIWYGAVLTPLPGPREALHIGEVFYLSNRGLNMPAPIFGERAWLGLVGLGIGIIGTIILRRWAARRQAATGEPFPVISASIGLIVFLPIIIFAMAGWPMTLDYPKLGGFNFSGGATIIPGFIAMLMALSVYTGSFIAENVRAGIQAVSHGQTEAARALGLRQGSVTRLVIIPQAMRVIIPPLANQYLNLTKNSSLAVAIGYPDLVATGGTVLNQTGQAIEVFLIWMAVYLSLSLLTSAFMNAFNSRMKLVER